MFSNLGPLFKTTFRKAESTDTRQGIQREDKKITRHRDEKPDDNRISVDLWEDDASVSVESLRAFLIDFLKNNKNKDATKVENYAKPLENKTAKPKNTIIAKATNAYQSLAEKTAPSSIPSLKENDPVSDADLIESEEIRRIHTLIEDLDTLSSNNINALYIQKADSFVESLQNAVRLQLSNI